MEELASEVHGSEGGNALMALDHGSALKLHGLSSEAFGASVECAPSGDTRARVRSPVQQP